MSYLHQPRNAQELAAFMGWNVNNPNPTFSLRWLAARVLADADDVPTNNTALTDMALYGSLPLQEVISVYREIAGSDDPRNLLVCVERPETLRFIAMVLRHLSIPFSAVYAGINFASLTTVQQQITTVSPQVVLYEYSQLFPGLNMHYLCADALLIEPPTNVQSHQQVKDCLHRNGQRRKQNVLFLWSRNDMSQFIMERRDRQVWGQ